MSANPAALAGLHGKGGIERGQRRRPRRLRPGGHRAGGRPAAAPQEPGHALPRPGPQGRRPDHLAAGPADRRHTVRKSALWRSRCTPSPPARPRAAQPRRLGRRRQRRVLRRQGEPDPARTSRLPGGDVRQQGAGVRRLGDAAPPRARPRLGAGPARPARRDPRRGDRHGLVQGQLPAVRLRRGGRGGGSPVTGRAGGGRLGGDRAQERAEGDAEHHFEVDRRAAATPTCG